MLAFKVVLILFYQKYLLFVGGGNDMDIFPLQIETGNVCEGGEYIIPPTAIQRAIIKPPRIPAIAPYKLET